MNSQHRHTYAESGVDISVEGEVIKALTRHFTAKKKGRGSPINIEGAYAGLLDMGDFILGITTDGVGSKVLVATETVSYTHLRAHETGRNLVCRLLLEKKKKIK